MNEHDPIDRAVKAAGQALCFDDSTDFGMALWEVLEALAPEVADAVEAHLDGEDLLAEIAARIGMSNE